MTLPPATVTVERGPHRIHAREQPGDGPAIVLMHGFPDNHHLYDRLVPYLPDRHVVAFDFLGWGESDKPAEHDYTFENRAGDLDAVVKALGLDRVVLVPTTPPDHRRSTGRSTIPIGSPASWRSTRSTAISPVRR